MTSPETRLVEALGLPALAQGGDELVVSRTGPGGGVGVEIVVQPATALYSQLLGLRSFLALVLSGTLLSVRPNCTTSSRTASHVDSPLVVLKLRVS